jgi:hypothetical protein
MIAAARIAPSGGSPGNSGGNAAGTLAMEFHLRLGLKRAPKIIQFGESQPQCHQFDGDRVNFGG